MKKLSAWGLILILSIAPVFAQKNNVIEPISKKEGIFSGIINFIVQYWLWFLIGITAIIIVVFIILLVRRTKRHVDPFKRDYIKTKQLCKFQKDPTIKSVYLVNDKGLKYLGKYLGECTTNDGYFNILLWKFKKWYLFWIPIFLDFFDLVKEDFIIRCNTNDEYTFMEKDKQGNITKNTIQLENDLFYKDGDKIIIKGVGIERVRYFFYPVLHNQDGDVVNKKLEVFAREKESALVETLYDQVEDFANISREIANMNPSVRYFQKTGKMPNKQEK